MPIELCIDTISNQYYIHFKGLARASIESHKEEILIIKLKISFLSFRFYPLRNNKEIKKTHKVEKHKNKNRRSSFNTSTALRVLKTFKVNRFLINIDTGDCINNAKLYPLFAFLNCLIGGFNINYNGTNQFVLYLKNRPFSIIKSIVNI